MVTNKQIVYALCVCIDSDDPRHGHQSSVPFHTQWRDVPQCSDTLQILLPPKPRRTALHHGHSHYRQVADVFFCIHMRSSHNIYMFLDIICVLGNTTLLALRKTLPPAFHLLLPHLPAHLPCSPPVTSVSISTTAMAPVPLLDPPHPLHQATWRPAALVPPSRSAAPLHLAALSQPPLPHSCHPDLHGAARAWPAAHTCPAILFPRRRLASTRPLADWLGSSLEVTVSVSLSHLPYPPDRLWPPAVPRHVSPRPNRRKRLLMSLRPLRWATPNLTSSWIVPPNTTPNPILRPWPSVRLLTAVWLSVIRFCTACSRTAALQMRARSLTSRRSLRPVPMRPW